VRDSVNTGSRISFEQSVDQVDLDVSQAIPLGLIINEGLVNAIKYAFPGDREGVVRIHFHRGEADAFLLSITDNGTGLPGHADTEEKNSLGLELMKGLARQLNGTFSLKSNDGLQLEIRFTGSEKQV
jgi:two-component sensor histidine kinase